MVFGRMLEIFARGIPGTVHFDPFQNFGYNRSYSVSLAKQSCQRSIICSCLIRISTVPGCVVIVSETKKESVEQRPPLARQGHSIARE